MMLIQITGAIAMLWLFMIALYIGPFYRRVLAQKGARR